MTTIHLLVAVSAGVATPLLSRPVVRIVLNRLAPWDDLQPPSGVAKTQWEAVVRGGGGARAASWLGAFECLLAYVAMILFEKEAATLIGGWLAFKVASKWESWSNVGKVPETLGDLNVSQLDFLRARRQWGTMVYTRFLVGTLLNVVMGVLTGVIVRRALEGC
jgi:hypothetical protein